MNNEIMKLDWQMWVLILLATSAFLRNGFAAYNKILDRIQASKQTGGNSRDKIPDHFEPCETVKNLQSEHNRVILDMQGRLASVEAKTERIPIIETKLDKVLANGFFK